MEKKRKITQYRERLDKTLASPNLTNKEALKVLVKDQLLRSSENEIKGCNANIIEERTAEVSNLLDMLRSASLGDDEGLKTCDTPSQPEWKLKQDNEEFRVMYREGIQGSPFHTLLVEGYIDGPVDVCLCISCEAELYKKWWPQSTIPTFKILSGKCLQKVGIGEHVSVVRMKIPWPLSAREAVVHYFVFEYYEDDLIVCLLNTISDFEGIEGGLKNEATDVAKDVVRIDVVGGFALQKVTEDRSYFRTIANMDIKMDLIPPSLINFVSRQLIGNGFRLYQKVVSSKLNRDEDYSKALRGPLYSRIREALSSLHESKRLVEGKKLHDDASNLFEEHLTKNKMNDLKLVNMDEKVHNELLASESTPDDAHFTGGNTCEIEEVESEESKTEEIESEKSKIEEVQSKESRQLEDQTSNRIPERGHINGKRNVFISPEVEQAIRTIDKVILKVRQYRFSAEMPSSGFNTEVSGKEKDGGNPKSLEDEIHSSEHLSAVPKPEDTEGALTTPLRSSTAIQNISYAGSNYLSKEVNHNRIVPTSPLCSSKDGAAEVPVVDNIMHGTDQVSCKEDDTHQGSPRKRKMSRRQIRRGLCCFSINSGQIDS
ncbi:PREDICTED: uncharacterized protein LOC101299210 [Fragaria vesca subsp. vesca]|uniref:uncharacterized protein LOC101299210 n=1 Tax=Fragaria vesca subsp. vesca TaxID=101020 RepID=UPI0002C36D86|nr:PREDICTED: uncharacterized protein LOC101299210 [Fragaria vesca subsp. vesca]XP_011467178.1 PREDICTED: uncharacterized protein LOC101299210 [Fragaria vesca subsp. vesca]XP_011467179.1 PREDICTED: uncharacterized protein LOC101299210 [Fragaria vesca subsp. vesca]